MADLSREFIEARKADGRSPYTIQHLTYALRRFTQVFRDQAIKDFTPADLAYFKRWLLDREPKLAPRSVNHELDAARNMLNWAVDMGYMPALSFRAVKPMAVPPPEPRGYSIAEARSMYGMAPAWLQPWIHLSWLTACRPTETVRLVQRLGVWCDYDGRAAADQGKAPDKYGLFRLQHGHSKTDVRYILFSRAALKSLAACEPRFKRPDAYSRACARHCDSMRPHFLRHGAATWLARHCRTTRADVDAVLGHYPSRVSRTYNPLNWKALRQLVARIPRLSDRSASKHSC